MHFKTFISVLLITGSIIIAPANVHAQHKASVQSSQGTVEEIYRLINKHRVSKGLKPLVVNDAIAKEAAKHSKNMASGRVPFGHDGFDGRV